MANSDNNDTAPFTVERLSENPVIHPGMTPSPGTNINGPSVIAVPDWVTHRLGRFYMYFADHRGDHIKLAFADHPAGPWTLHAPGVLHVSASGFPADARLLDPPEADRDAVASGDLRPHIASPDVHVDAARREIVMYFHGLEADCRQTTRRACSDDGLSFGASTPVCAIPYVRVFDHDGGMFAATFAGYLGASPDGGMTFPEGAAFGERRTRHVAVLRHDGRLYLVFSRIGDCPERLLIARIVTGGNWRDWRLTPPQVLLGPETAWEGAHAPLVPSRMGPADTPVNQLRDPCILADAGALWLYYSVAGERGIAVARLHPAPR